MMARRPTVQDVARRAGVSLMTVSRVVNGAPKVAEATRQRVREAIEALGFVPSRAARSLRSRRSHWIAVLGRAPAGEMRPDVYSYLSDLQSGLITRCRQDGYHVAFESIDAGATSLSDVTGDLARRLAPDGIVLLPPLSDDKALLDALRASSLPVVRIGPSARRDDPAPCVLMDDEAAAYEMTALLLQSGHRRIGFVQGPPDHPSSAQRYAGFRAALAAHGIEPRRDDVAPGRYTAESGAQAARRLLSAHDRTADDRLTAIFASNDDMAAGSLAVAHEIGLRVPEELSIVGFDDTYVAGMLHPPLTTVRQPIYDMGFAAAHQLLGLLRDGDATACVQLSHRLVQRGTVGRIGVPVGTLTALSGRR